MKLLSTEFSLVTDTANTCGNASSVTVTNISNSAVTLTLAGTASAALTMTPLERVFISKSPGDTLKASANSSLRATAIASSGV